MNSTTRVEKVDNLDNYALINFFYCEAPQIALLFGGNFDWRNFDLHKYARNHHVWICWRGHEPIGIMMAQLYGSVFDFESKVLWQDLLYVKKSSSRAAFLLMKEFIAFGRANAKLVFTARTKHTNVKESTLERLGFFKTEELYQLRIT